MIAWAHIPPGKARRGEVVLSFTLSLPRFAKGKEENFLRAPSSSLPPALFAIEASLVRSFAPSLFYDEDSGRARVARNGVASSLPPRSSRTNRCFVTRGNFGDSKYLVSLLRPSTSLSLLPGSRHKLQWSTSKLRVTQTKCF